MLREAIKSIGLSLTNEQERAFMDYLGLLQERNSQFNLISNSETEEIIWKHFIDSLAVHQQFKETISGSKDITLLDIGSGAGFPGIPIKIVFPDLQLVIIEATKKKTEFLQEIVEKLMLDKVSVIWGRSEEYAHHPVYREKFDIVVSRAVAEMNTLVELALPFIKSDGYFVAYKGPKGKQELEGARQAIIELGGEEERFIEIGIKDFIRTFIFIRKKQSTPQKYPRKSGIPQKRPL